MLKRLILLIAVLFFSNIPSYAANLDLSYEYKVPYSGGGTLIIYNNGDEPIHIRAVSFKWNAGISGNPWGTLWGWQSVLNQTPAQDDINTLVTIFEKPTLIINAKNSAYLSYNVDRTKMGGPLSPYNIALFPTDLRITLADSSALVDVKMKDSCVGEACKDPGNGKIIMGYYPNWAYWRTPPFTAEQLPFNKINTLGYAFLIFDKDGRVSLYDQDSDAVNIPIIGQARLRYPYFNAFISFGGWSWASTPPGWQCQAGASPMGPAACFSEMAANDISRATFVRNAVLAMKEVYFNGIDIDWEYPASPEDAKNYLQLLKDLRLALDAQAKTDAQTYYLTVAVPAGIDKMNALTKEQWQMLAEVVTSLGVMTYDFHGAWDTGITGSNFMSAMQLDKAYDPTIHDTVLGQYDVVHAMNAYLERGVPAKKLILGIPLYGRMVQIEQAGISFGLYQHIIGTPQGEWDNQQSGFTGMVGYQCIVDKTRCGNQYLFPDLKLVDPTQNVFGKYALTPWGYSKDFFVTYDDASSAAYKANWVLQQGFGGVMLWDLTGDFNADDTRSIVNIIDQIFANP